MSGCSLLGCQVGLVSRKTCTSSATDVDLRCVEGALGDVMTTQGRLSVAQLILLIIKSLLCLQHGDPIVRVVVHAVHQLLWLA